MDPDPTVNADPLAGNRALVVTRAAPAVPATPAVVAAAELTAAVVDVVLGRVIQVVGLAPVPAAVVDPLWALGRGTAVAGFGVLRRLGSVVAPVARVALDPPLLPTALAPGTHLRALTEQGRRERERAKAAAQDALARLVREAVVTSMAQLDLTDIVLRGVDLNAIAAGIDIEAILDRVDIDGVAARLSLQPIIDRIDVNAIAATVDVPAIIDRLDLADITQAVLDDVDLPAIIRESSGAMASESVQSVRLQSMRADEVLGRWVDRMTMRRRERLPPMQDDDEDAAS